MPIYNNCHAFMPEEVKILGDAFDDTIKALHIDRREDWMARLVARQIIELAKHGERDRERLVLATFARLCVTIGTRVSA